MHDMRETIGRRAGAISGTRDEIVYLPDLDTIRAQSSTFMSHVHGLSQPS